MYDILIRNGTLLDAGLNLDRRADLAIADGRISAHLAPGSPAEARRTIDAQDLIVAPGFVDLHVHVFGSYSHYGIDADPTCLARGVTTALDAGSSGALNFPAFRRYVIEVSETRIFALLNISAIGMVSGLESDPPLGELEDLRYCDVGAAIRMVEANRDAILGIKIRLTDDLAHQGKNEWPALLRAREASDAVGLPLMVHSPRSSLPIDRILNELRPGDVLTHCFHGHRCGILDDDLRILPSVRKKVEAGMLLDVGHGKGSFSFPIARSALAQDMLPHTISSDLHRYNLRGPVFDLVTTLNKFLHLGVSLKDALLRVTTTPAHFVGMENEIGTLREGAVADIVVLSEEHGQFELTDSMGVSEVADRALQIRYILRQGNLVSVSPIPPAGPPPER